MLENITYEYMDKHLKIACNSLNLNDKIYGAFIFGSRYHRDNRIDSDYDIALFTDLEFFDIADIEENLNSGEMKFDISDVADLPIIVQEEIMYEPCNVLFLKDAYMMNWVEHMEYLKNEINFKRMVQCEE